MSVAIFVWLTPKTKLELMVARATLKFFKARQQFSADTWGNARTEIEKAGLLVLANQCINVKNLTSKFFRC